MHTKTLQARQVNRPLHDLLNDALQPKTYFTLKLMRSTCGKSNHCYDVYFRPDVDQQPQVPQTSHAPAMMTFKQFLNAQDDNISDEEAFKKYQEYKLEFRKTQMSDFFQQHKEEEWYVVIFIHVSVIGTRII